MQTIDNYDFSGKKAIVRVDFNVPLDNETLIHSPKKKSSSGLKYAIVPFELKSNIPL